MGIAILQCLSAAANEVLIKKGLKLPAPGRYTTMTQPQHEAVCKILISELCDAQPPVEVVELSSTLFSNFISKLLAAPDPETSAFSLHDTLDLLGASGVRSLIRPWLKHEHRDTGSKSLY